MAKKKKWCDEQLIAAVAKNTSIYGVLKDLDLKLSGGSHATIKLRIKQLNLDSSHFTGQGWCNGEKHKSFITRFIEIPLVEILRKESTYQCTHKLKLRLWKEGLLEKRCYKCEMGPEWQGEPLSLQLDHIDGDRTNHELVNLRILCPNCHSQTKNYAGKCNKRRHGGTRQTQEAQTLPL